MEEWSAPLIGSIKFNTYGAVRGSFGLTGFERSLRNVVSWLLQSSMTKLAFKEIVSDCLVAARNLNWKPVLVDRLAIDLVVMSTGVF
ncbi:hypothetical protein V6N12_024948 [Hibiscus sabdariffa]|uniref:Uncharacterized protein n=1 Tax=Hibiscus sabdariffa TaxID=183260 RepID=A0ABR2A5S7_9ROSI